MEMTSISKHQIARNSIKMISCSIYCIYLTMSAHQRNRPLVSKDSLTRRCTVCANIFLFICRCVHIWMCDGCENAVSNWLYVCALYLWMHVYVSLPKGNINVSYLTTANQICQLLTGMAQKKRMRKMMNRMRMMAPMKYHRKRRQTMNLHVFHGEVNHRNEVSGRLQPNTQSNNAFVSILRCDINSQTYIHFIQAQS